MKFQVRKPLLGFLMILALSLTALGCGGENLAEDVAAEVGGVQITQAQLGERVEQIQQQLGEQVPSEESDPEGFDTFRREVLDYLVTLEIVTQKAGEAGVEVTEEEIDEQLAKLKEPYGGDEAKFEQAIAQQNLSLEELRENLRQQGLITKMIEEVTKDIEVSDEEVATFYEEQKQQLSVDETRRVSHILFSPQNAQADDEAEVTEANWQAALEEAQRVRRQIMEGAAFAELAKQLSDDPGSKDEGGDVGVIERGA
ncbi:MAG TPA: SurA N-terminal domain-containing protein, partial [Thermoleophilia bacterium]|nr:SurA N-terminal domain-containing protein [Thermoleophilia bacterium]